MTWSSRLLSQRPTIGVRRMDVQRGTDAGGLVREAHPDLVDDLCEVDQLHVQLEPPGGDARHVEQLVDQTVKPRRLRIDLLDLRDQARRALGAVPARDPRQVRDLQLQRRQRRAQLVRRDRQEVVAQDDRLAQGVLGALLIVDVGRGRDPADDVAFGLALRHRAREVPAIAAVRGPLDPHLAFERGAAAQSGLPVGARLGAIVRVQALPERFLADVGQLEPAVGEAGTIPVVDLAARVRRPDALRHHVEQAPVAFLALAFEHLAIAFAQHPFLQLQLLAAQEQLDEHGRLRAQDVRRRTASRR